MIILVSCQQQIWAVYSLQHVAVKLSWLQNSDEVTNHHNYYDCYIISLCLTGFLFPSYLRLDWISQNGTLGIIGRGIYHRLDVVTKCQSRAGKQQAHWSPPTTLQFDSVRVCLSSSSSCWVSHSRHQTRTTCLCTTLHRSTCNAKQCRTKVTNWQLHSTQVLIYSWQHVNWTVLPSQSWHKGSNIPSIKCLAVDQERMKPLYDCPWLGSVLWVPRSVSN